MILELSSIQVYMAWFGFPIFFGIEDAKTWLQDYGLFLLEIGLSEHEGVQQVFPLLVRGKAKRWFDGLHDEVKTDRGALEKAFRHKYVLDTQPHEVKNKLDGMKQRLDGDFKSFEWEFEALWQKLLEVTATHSNEYLKLSKFMACLHEDVRDKVEVDDPTTYADTVSFASGRTKKLLKKTQASQVLQEEQNVLWLQRDGAISLPKMPTKEVQVMEEPFKSMGEVVNTQASSGMVCQISLGFARGQRVRFANKAEDISDLETEEEVEADSSSSMDTDTSWETESSYSRYEDVDILHVDRVVKEDVLEDHIKMQEDKLDTGYVKGHLPTNEDMQVNEERYVYGGHRGKLTRFRSKMVLLCSRQSAWMLIKMQQVLCTVWYVYMQVYVPLNVCYEANIAVKYGYNEAMYAMGACKSYILSLKHGEHIGFSWDPGERYKWYEVAVSFPFDQGEDFAVLQVDGQDQSQTALLQNQEPTSVVPSTSDSATANTLAALQEELQTEKLQRQLLVSGFMSQTAQHEAKVKQLELELARARANLELQKQQSEVLSKGKEVVGSLTSTSQIHQAETHLHIQLPLMLEMPEFLGTQEEEQPRPALEALDVREQIEQEIEDMPKGPAKENLLYEKKVMESAALAFLQPEEQNKDFGHDFLPLPLMCHEAILWKEKMRPAVPRNEEGGYEDIPLVIE
ncbi:hypothetical protein L7F22_011531 [Adiantum nelumboides]|nr:hypothetical protein [Adiantum nelumboides]